MSGVAQHRPAAGATVPTAGRWRLVRGAAVGVTATALALGGHVLGGGTPAVVPVVVLGAGAVALSVVMSARRWTTGSLLAVLLGMQAVAHVALAHAGHSGLLAGAGHHGHATNAAFLATSGHTDGVAMLTGHVVAAVATAVLLRCGENWCWRLLELAVGAVRAIRPLVAVEVPGLVRRRVTTDRDVVWQAAVLDLARPRRGPPALLLG